MKFRTDFVTNSSSSGFVCFHIRNRELFDSLINLGLRFENTQDGVFTNNTRVVLPSGNSRAIVNRDRLYYPYLTESSFITSWLMQILLDLDLQEDPETEDDGSDFNRELTDLLIQANMLPMDRNEAGDFSRKRMVSLLDAQFSSMDSAIEEAKIEHTCGFEGEVGRCVYAEVSNEQRIFLDLQDLWIHTESCAGKQFVISGELSYFDSQDQLMEMITHLGGCVAQQVSEKTDYLICNNIYSASAGMQKAKAPGICVLSEAAFIRRFCNAADYNGIKDVAELCEQAWEMTYCGGLLEFVMENGTQPVKMQLWKDGRWA